MAGLPSARAPGSRGAWPRSAPSPRASPGGRRPPPSPRPPDHAYSRVLAIWGLGTLHVVRGDPARAIPILGQGLVVSRMADIPLLFPFVAAPLGAAYVLAGRVDDAAVPLLERAVRQAVSMNLLANHALRLTWRETFLITDQIERAGEQAAQALALAERLGERGARPTRGD